jgi:uracil-DNA glycosylase family 4
MTTTENTTTTRPEPTRPAPDPDCGLCPRLCAFRQGNRQAEPDWFNAPVPSFGPGRARLAVVGLAPGMRGANRTGRPFTGDFAGAVLYPALWRHGFARGSYGADPGDGFELVDCRICNAVRCVPPENRPTPAEAATCRQFLVPELTGLDAPRAILVLGRIAHESALRALGLPQRGYPFAHGGWHQLPTGQLLASSFHTSRYNVNTGRLTEAMFDLVVARLAAELAERPPLSRAV